MSFEVVNAVLTHPHRCEFCTSNQPPFIDTQMHRPTGGTFHLCSTCWRQVLVAVEAVAKIDHDALPAPRGAANAEVADLRAERIDVDVDVVTAELTNVRAELELLRAERITHIAEIGRLERDNGDLRDMQMPRSEVPAATATIREEALAEVVAKPVAKGAQKPREKMS